MAVVDELGKKKRLKKKRRILKSVLSVILLAIISVAAAVMITNNGRLSLDGFKRLFNIYGSFSKTAEFTFDSGSQNVYSDLNGGFAVASTVGIQVYDKSCNLSFSDIFEMSRPALCAGGDIAAVYDLGGLSLKMFNLDGVTKSISTNGKIISASLNKNGWLAVCTQESGGYKSQVTVYDKKGAEHYKWYSASGYILSAAISPDNGSLAVLTLNNEGSRIVFFTLDSTYEKAACTLKGELVLEIKYFGGGNVLAVSKNGLSVVKPDGSVQTIKDYHEKYLDGYSIESEDFTALVLHDYMVGDQGSIMTIDHNGAVLGTLETGRRVLSISARGNYLAVLYSDGFVIYNRKLKECTHIDGTAGAIRTIMRADGTSLLITAHSATIYDSAG